jgi:hypothetical protein
MEQAPALRKKGRGLLLDRPQKRLHSFSKAIWQFLGYLVIRFIADAGFHQIE